MTTEAVCFITLLKAIGSYKSIKTVIIIESCNLGRNK